MPKVTITHEDGRVEELEISEEAAQVAAVEIVTVNLRAVLEPQLGVTKEVEAELIRLGRGLAGTAKGIERG